MANFTVEIGSDGLPVLEKDPAAVRNYSIKLRDHPRGSYLKTGQIVNGLIWEVTHATESPPELKVGDGVTTHETPHGTVTPAAPVYTIDGVLTATLYGGTPGEEYKLTAKFSTSGIVCVDERTITIRVKEL